MLSNCGKLLRAFTTVRGGRPLSTPVQKHVKWMICIKPNNCSQLLQCDCEFIYIVAAFI